MATYIPGVTDYIPQIQPFQPDLNFYSGALQMKQSQYDTNHQQISNLYGSLLNAPMLREQNIKAREDYFTAINSEIKKISNLDLSKQENVSAASNLFKGLYDNENIIKDMVWTRNYQGEIKRANGFRNCVDPAKCGGSYWEGGVKALNYKADEFMKASAQEALNFGNARFTPFQNVMEMAIKASKEAGLNITVDQLQGRYITTTKNGPALIDPLNALFTGLFGQNEQIMDYYKTKAYVDRKDWVSANVGVYGNEADAEIAYLNQVSTGLNEMFGKVQTDVNARVDNFGAQRKQLEARIQKEGTTPNSSLAQQYRELNDLEGQSLASQQTINDAQGMFTNAMDPAMRNLVGENLDGAMASIYLGNDIGMAAQTLAYKDYEFKMREDPYAMESVKQANRLALEDVRFENKKLFEKFRYDLAAWEEKKTSMGGEADNIPVLQRLVEGGADINLEEGGAFKMYKKNENGIVKDISGGEKTILVEMLNLTQLKSKSEKGAGIATDDLVKFGDIIFNELANVDTRYYIQGEDTGEYISNAQLAKDNKALKAKWDGMTYSQKVKYAQGQDFNKLINHSGLSGTVLDNAYSDYALPLMDQSNEANQVNRNYLSGLWANSAAARNDINLKNHLLQGMGDWYTGQTQKVIQDMKTTDEFKALAPLMQMYINPETGGKRSAPEFAKLYGEARSKVDGVDFTEAYNEGLAIYSGKDPFGGGGTSVMSNAVSWALGGIPGLIYNNSEDETGFSLDKVWAQAFSKFMDPEGGAMALGLIGSDSNAAMGLNFPSVDPSKYSSGATMNTISFMNDVFVAGSDGSRIQIGRPGTELPEASNPTLQAFFNQLYSDMNARKSPTDAKRPMLNVTYQDIAGGDSEWTAMNIKVNQPYLFQFVGSEKTPKMLSAAEANQLSADGFTVYLNKNGATNGFRQSVQKSPIEQTMFYTGKYDFDSYPQITQDLQLKQNPSGGYILSGNVMAGVDTQGQPIWEPIYNPYNSLGTDPSLVVADINNWLSEVNLGNQNIIANHNAKNGTKDPQALLNQ